MGLSKRSNRTGLRVAVEASLGVLPGASEETGVWRPRRPESYGQFGQITETEADEPLAEDRSDQPSASVGVSARANWKESLTSRLYYHSDDFQGFVFADVVEPACTAPINGAGVALGAINGTTEQFTAASGLDAFSVGSLAIAGPNAAFANAINRGLHRVTASAATTATVATNLVTETPSAGAFLRKVGDQWGSGELDIVAPGGVTLPKIVRASGTKPLTDLGNPGDPIFLGGDGAAFRFAGTVNRGWAVINAVSATECELRETQFEMVSETGTGLTIQIFHGAIFGNQVTAANIKERYVQCEQTITDQAGTQSRYEKGGLHDKLKLTLASKKIAKIDIGIVCLNEERRTIVQGVKPGTRPTIAAGSAYNATSHVRYRRLSLVQEGEAAVTPLVALYRSLELEINNGVQGIDVIGERAAVDYSTGNFKVSGKLDAIFVDFGAADAIDANSDVSFSLAFSQPNQGAPGNHGLFFHIPAMRLSGGDTKIVKNQPITIDITKSAFRSPFGHSLKIAEYSYLPQLAIGIVV